jgi:cation transport protein ChaC
MPDAFTHFGAKCHVSTTTFDQAALMSLNTIAINKSMNQFDGHHEVWLFGYGSLIFKADFSFIERRPASIRNWTRRFWQGSHDHRGTEASPGRVATLIPQAGAVCEGMAYLITPQVFDHLDYREKNGYLRFSTDITFDDGNSVEGLVYIATQDNAAFVGPASESDIARQIARAVGPSGRNRDYLIDLAAALRVLGKDDPHVFAIEQYLIQLELDPSGRA